MQRRDFLRSTGVVTLASAVCVAAVLMLGACQSTPADPNCKPFNFRPGGGVVIAESGRYCMQHNTRVSAVYSALTHGNPYKNSDVILMVLGADNLDVDFQGHTLTSEAQVNFGIETPNARNPNHIYLPEFASLLEGRKRSERLSLPIPRNIKLANGKLLMNFEGLGRNGIRITGLGGLVDDQTPVMVLSDLGNFPALYETIIRNLPATASAYPMRNVVIEKMDVRAAYDDVIVQGAGTIIRDSVLETDAGTAIWIYGPNAIIENNTIIVHGTNRLREADAPIRLIQADGAVIRNNKIILKDKANQRIVSAFQTGAFTVEGNTFVGLKDSALIAKDWSGELRMKASNNRLEK